MLSAWQASEVTAGEATCASSCSAHALSAGALAKADPAFVIREAGGREAGPTCPPEPWRRLIRPSSSGKLEGGKQVRLVRRSLGGGGQRHVRQSRRAEPHSLPHVLWRSAYKVAAARAASFDFPPRKCRAGLPCRRRHRKSSRPLLRGGSRPFVPQARLRHFVPWRSFLARGTSGAASPTPPHAQAGHTPDRLGH